VGQPFLSTEHSAANLDAGRIARSILNQPNAFQRTLYECIAPAFAPDIEYPHGEGGSPGHAVQRLYLDWALAGGVTLYRVPPAFRNFAKLHDTRQHQRDKR
jgi:hypothetical protein